MTDTLPEHTGEAIPEYCPKCGDETAHSVTLKVEASTEEKYSRQPHRISQCTDCGRTVEARVGY